LLVVNADDFGKDDAVNRAVVRCFGERICSSTTIMPNMPGFEEACALAFEKGFHERVGLHLVLDEGMPLSKDILSEKRFCTKDGALGLSRESPVFRLSGPEKSALAKEIRAQIRKCRDRGLPIVHVDSHHHVHTEWAIAMAMIPVLREEGISFARISRDLGLNTGMPRRLYKRFYNSMLKRNRLRGTDHFGSVDEYRAFRMRQGNTDSITEVMIHPIIRNDELYVTESMKIEQYERSMGPYLETERLIAFCDLIPRQKP